MNQATISEDPTNRLYLVSAIISTYKSERFIRGCLEDLESQTIANRLEIIVIDSCSPENERAIVEEFQHWYTNIKYIRTNQRETIYQAWNRGIKAARGKFVTNANCDDRHRSDAFERLATTLEANPDCAVVYADCAVTALENDKFETAKITGYFKWPDFDLKKLFLCCYIGPQPMWRRSLHERHQWFDSEMKSTGDYEFWLRLASRGEQIVHLPEVLGLYLDSPGSIEHSNVELCHQESELARQRYWPFYWGKRPSASGSYYVPAIEERPLVSVIIPTRNRESFLAHALESLLAQDYDHWEAWIVNDGGNSVDSLVASLDVNGRIRCLNHSTSLGPAAARNTALRLARGTIICYLDDDDFYLPQHLSCVVREMRESCSPFVYTDFAIVTESIDGEGHRHVHERRQINDPSREFSRKALHIVNYIPIDTWGHLRDCLLTCGPFDETLPSHEDWEFLLRMAEHFGFRRVPELTTEVRVRKGAMDSVTSRQAHRDLEVYRLIYRRYNSLAADSVVRRGRRRKLGLYAERERISGRAGRLRMLWLSFLSGRGRFLPIQRTLDRYLDRHLWWRFNGAKPGAGNSET